MIKLVLAIFLCCVGLCLGQDCDGSTFLEFENFSRQRSVKISDGEYKGIGPGKPVRAVYKRDDNKPFTLMSLSAKAHNARRVRLHAVGSEKRKDVDLTNVTDAYLPVVLLEFPIIRLVFNVQADDKTVAASLNDISIVGCLPSEETSTSSNAPATLTTTYMGR